MDTRKSNLHGLCPCTRHRFDTAHLGDMAMLKDFFNFKKFNFGLKKFNPIEMSCLVRS